MESTPSPLFLVDPQGIEQVRGLQKTLQSMMEEFQKEFAELKEKVPVKKRLYTVAEAAEYLAVSEDFLRKDCSEGPRKNRTPGPDPWRCGNIVRYVLEDMDEWIEIHRKPRAYLN